MSNAIDHLLYPKLAGRLLTGIDQLASKSSDFGRIRQSSPIAVVEPRDADDIAEILGFARKQKLKVSARGQGYSTFGQSLIDGGIVIDMGTLDPAPRIRGNRLTIGAGATWRDALRATLPWGKKPPVLPSFLGLTVGGTLSVGGIGGESFKCGALVDQVQELQVLTGAGDLVACSMGRNPGLFEAVLGGMGQCAIIVRATLKLVQAAPKASGFTLRYRDLQGMLKDCRFLVSTRRFDKIIANILPRNRGRWEYALEAVCFHHESTRLAMPDLLEGLQSIDIRVSIYSMPYMTYADRLRKPIKVMESVSGSARPQPWIDVFIPDSRMERFTEELLAELTPGDLGPDWPILIYPLQASNFRRRLPRIPRADFFWLFDLLSSAVSASSAGKMLVRNRKIFERARKASGKHYPISAVNLDRKDWQSHFHPHWQWLSRAKRRFDPECILSPGPGIFA